MLVNSIQLGEQYFPSKEIQNQKKDSLVRGKISAESVDAFSKSSEVSTNSEQKVTFKEGVKLVGQGFINKIKCLGKAIVQHPIRTIAAVGATTLALAALPLIGITAATGAAVLAVGFAAFAVGKTIADVVETVKDNKAGRYNEVREDLQKIGGDGVDLALSLPFVPKAARQLTRFAKYGTSTVGLNTELIANLKNVRNVQGVATEFAKAETLINYEMIGNEMGLAVKPKMVFKDLGQPGSGSFLGAVYEPTTGELQINQNVLTGKGKMLTQVAKADTESLIRHELEHFRQFSDVARTEGLGVEGLNDMLTEYYKLIEKKFSAHEIEQGGISNSTVENMLHGDKSVFNRKFYQSVVDSEGTIKAGTHEAEMAAQYCQGMMEKINPRPEHIAAFEQETAGITNITMMINPADRAKVMKAQMNLYKANILEKEAYAAQDVFRKANITSRPGMVVSNAEAVVATVPDDEIIGK